TFGRWIGRLHHASQLFQPQGPMRFHWFEDPLFRDPEHFLPESEPRLREEFAALIKYINARPASRENYGLVHGDLGPHNWRIQGDRVTAFDFDDCCYHWFAFDIAVAMVAARRLQAKYRRGYLASLLDGYAQEKDLGGA